MEELKEAIDQVNNLLEYDPPIVIKEDKSKRFNIKRINKRLKDDPFYDDDFLIDDLSTLSFETVQVLIKNEISIPDEWLDKIELKEEAIQKEKEEAIQKEKEAKEASGQEKSIEKIEKNIKKLYKERFVNSPKRIRLKFISSLIENKGIDKSVLIEKTSEKFPNVKIDTIKTDISDGKNPKYCLFEKLLIERDGKIFFK